MDPVDDDLGLRAAGATAAGGGMVRPLLLSVLVLVVVLVVRRAARAYANLRHMRKVAADIPGPPGMPIIGNVLDVLAGGDDHIFENCCRLMEEYGPTAKAWLGPELVVAVADPRDVEYVATSQELIDKSAFYGVLEPLLGRGLSCLGGQEIRRHRKIVSPSLHLDILHDFLQVFQRKALQFAARLEQHADDGGDFDVSPVCLEFSLGAALETIMSTDLDEDDGDRKTFSDVLQAAQDLFMYRVWHPWFLDDTVFRLSTRHAEYTDTMGVLNSFTERIIAEKRRQVALEKRQSQQDAAPKKRRAFLDNILCSEEGAALTDVELRDEVKTLLCTGSETSASTLSFIFMVLALRQDIQEKVVQELDDVFGGDDERAVTLEELPHLQYLERVIKETLRMFPVLPFFTRRCPRDVALPSGYTAPRGAHLTFFLPALHRDPRSWSKPRAFDPDRFLPEHTRDRHPFSYLPFSAGPRNCVGQRYAMLLLKTELATLLRRFHILPAPNQRQVDIADVPVKVTLVIAVKGGVRICVRRRTRAPSTLAESASSN